jgi:hypothetical protein
VADHQKNYYKKQEDEKNKPVKQKKKPEKSKRVQQKKKPIQGGYGNFPNR